jgi:hypothetical protein
MSLSVYYFLFAHDQWEAEEDREKEECQEKSG